MAAVITNLHAIEEHLKRGNSPAELFVDAKRGGFRSRVNKIIDLAKSKGVRVSFVSPRDMERLLGKRDYRGAALALQGSPLGSLKTILKETRESRSLFIVLDRITDPHNLGAIMRSADQFGVDAVVLPAHGSARDNETVAAVSSGASAWVRVAVEPNIRNAIEMLKKDGFWVFGADMQGDPITHVRFEGRIALVLGSEGKGLRRLVREACDGLVSIPSAGHVDSLNVSVAAGILIFEVRRQQRFFSAEER
jgi:23S rRNA (guanosine2251-2'-O)-methyltransferase